jgi:hypothetical protein
MKEEDNNVGKCKNAFKSKETGGPKPKVRSETRPDLSFTPDRRQTALGHNKK